MFSSVGSLKSMPFVLVHETLKNKEHGPKRNKNIETKLKRNHLFRQLLQTKFHLETVPKMQNDHIVSVSPRTVIIKRVLILF